MSGGSHDARAERSLLVPARPLATAAGIAGPIALLAANIACSTPPEPAECERFADHLVELLAKTEGSAAAVQRRAGGLREKMIASCLSQGSAAAVECALRRDTLDAIEADCP